MSKKNRKRLEIAEALLSLLKTKPIHDIYIVDLIEVAGISKRTFYNYFSDKHEVFLWWWKFQLAPYIDGNILDYTKQQLILLRDYRPCVLHVLSYTGQNNFLDDIIAYDIKLLRRHIHKDILLKHSEFSAQSGIEFTTKSAWVFFVELLSDPSALDAAIEKVETDPDSLVLAGSLSILVPYYSYPLLDKEEQM